MIYKCTVHTYSTWTILIQLSWLFQDPMSVRTQTHFLCLRIHTHVSHLHTNINTLFIIQTGLLLQHARYQRHRPSIASAGNPQQCLRKTRAPLDQKHFHDLVPSPSYDQKTTYGGIGTTTSELVVAGT